MSLRAKHRFEASDVPRARLALFGGLVTAGLLGWHHVLPVLLLEWALYASLLYALWGFGPVRELYHGSQAGFRGFAVVCVVALLLGQILKASTETFPAVGWSMYGAVHEQDPVFYEYEAVRLTGATDRLIPERVIPTLANARIDNRLKRQIADIEGSSSESARIESMRRHAATLRALVHLANRQGGNDPIVEVRVVRATIPLQGYRGEASILREHLWSIQMEASP